jgi:hypothetical protein
LVVSWVIAIKEMMSAILAGSGYRGMEVGVPELLEFVRLLEVRTIGFHMDGFSLMADNASSPARAMGEQGCFGASLAV